MVDTKLVDIFDFKRTPIHLRGIPRRLLRKEFNKLVGEILRSDDTHIESICCETFLVVDSVKGSFKITNYKQYLRARNRYLKYLSNPDLDTDSKRAREKFFNEFFS